MPTVPRLQSRVQRAALPGARVAVDTPQGAFGVASAVDLSGPLKLVGGLAEQHRQEADDTQLVASDNQLHDLKASIQQDTFQKYRGIAALGASQAARAAWEKGVADIEATIKAGDHVKQAFLRRAATHWGDLVSTVDSHSASEYKAAQTREFGSAIDNRITSAVDGYTDPVKRQTAIDEGRTLISVFAAHSGWSAEETTQKLAAFTSDAHASVIERMVNEHQDIQAKQYLAEHKAELVGKDLIQAERLTGEASVLGESQRQADAIMANRFAPGMLAVGNIDLTNRPRVRNPDGSISTVRSFSTEIDGKEVLLPTVSDSGKNLTEQEAIALYEKTGKHLGIFKDAETATAYAQQLHQQQAAMIAGKLPPQLDLSEALAQAATITDPRVREATEHRVRQGFADKAAESRQERAQAFQQASAIVEQTKSYDAIPLTVRMAMSPEENNALQHRVEQIRHPKDAGDSETYFHLLNLASLSPESRAQFANENLTAAGYPNLSDAQRQKLMTLQRSLSVRSEGVTTGHMAREAEAEQQRTDHLAEAELRKSDPAAAEVLRAQNLAKRHATYHGTAPKAPTAAAEARVTGHPASQPLAEILTAPQKPTRAMLEDIARKGDGYAAYLRQLGFDIPAGTPTHPQAAPVPTPAPTPAPAPVAAPAPAAAAVAPIQMSPAVVMAQPPSPATPAPTMASSTASLPPIKVTAPATLVAPAAPAKPVPGVPYEKSGHTVVDTPRPDARGYVPTHRIDQITNRKPNESWTQYEDRVLAGKSKTGDETIRNDLKLLEPDVHEAAVSMIAAAKADGVTLDPRETVRTQSRQEHIFRQGRSSPGEVATWTLTSDHTPGRAIDFKGGKKVIAWIEQNAARFGFTTLGDLDPGHVSIPQRPATVATRGRGQ